MKKIWSVVEKIGKNDLIVSERRTEVARVLVEINNPENVVGMIFAISCRTY
jgi:hypothetical protein